MAKEALHDINATTDYAADKSKNEIDELRKQVKDLTDKYGTMAESKFSEVKDKVSDKVADVKDKVQENVGDIEKQIREKPVQATLVAAGVGFLVGALLTR